MPKLPGPYMPKPKPICVACGDTGRATSGAPCAACLKNGRIKS